jgi:hypothetical protein
MQPAYKEALTKKQRRKAAKKALANPDTPKQFRKVHQDFLDKNGYLDDEEAKEAFGRSVRTFQELGLSEAGAVAATLGRTS